MGPDRASGAGCLDLRDFAALQARVAWICATSLRYMQVLRKIGEALGSIPGTERGGRAGVGAASGRTRPSASAGVLPRGKGGPTRAGATAEREPSENRQTVNGFQQRIKIILILS